MDDRVKGQGPPPLPTAKSPPLPQQASAGQFTARKGNRRRWILLTTGACVVIIAVVALLIFSRGGGSIWSSPYSADYRMVADSYGAYLEATINGPAAQLAVILTDPEGESRTWFLSKEQMITNSCTERLQVNDPREGTYVLTIKTIDPEKVVVQQEIPLSLGQMTVKDVTCDPVAKTQFGGTVIGYTLNRIDILVTKDGNLPVEFNEAVVSVDGKKCTMSWISDGRAMADREHTLSIDVHCPPNANSSRGGGLPYLEAIFRPGERHSLKGSLFYGQDRRSLDFEKEFVIGNVVERPRQTRDRAEAVLANERSRSEPRSAPVAPAFSPVVPAPQPAPRLRSGVVQAPRPVAPSPLSEPQAPIPESRPTPPPVDVPPGFKEGVDRLTQWLNDTSGLPGDFSDYRMIIPPNYKGDETIYEVGFLNSGVAFYVFRTIDGGQTWARRTPGNSVLRRIAEETRRGAGTRTSAPLRPMVEPPRAR